MACGGKMKRKDRPNPGSKEAIDLGCVCPVLDNAHGRGAWGTRGVKAIFWICGDCKLHYHKGDTELELDKNK